MSPIGDHAIGQVVLVGNVPLRIIGVVTASTNNSAQSNFDQHLAALSRPAISRITGPTCSRASRVSDTADAPHVAEAQAETLLEPAAMERRISACRTPTPVRETIQATTQTLTLADLGDRV